MPELGRKHGGEYRVESLTLPIVEATKDKKFFRQAGIATTAAFVRLDLKGGKNVVGITETGGTQSLEFSFDGVTLHGTVAANGNQTLNDVNVNGVWLKNGSGVATVTVEAHWSGD
jgi:hypothetical protein